MVFSVCICFHKYTFFKYDLIWNMNPNIWLHLLVAVIFQNPRGDWGVSQKKYFHCVQIQVVTQKDTKPNLYTASSGHLLPVSHSHPVVTNSCSFKPYQLTCYLLSKMFVSLKCGCFSQNVFFYYWDCLFKPKVVFFFHHLFNQKNCCFFSQTLLLS